MDRVFTILFCFLIVDLTGSSFTISSDQAYRISGIISLESPQELPTQLEPAIFAYVALYKEGTLVNTTETDIAGQYSFEAVSESSYIIKVQYLGYKADSVTVVLLENDQHINIEMQEESHLLEEIVILAYSVPHMTECVWFCGSIITSDTIDLQRDSISLRSHTFDTQESPYKIFPNPAHSVLNVDVTAEYDQLRLYSIHGAQAFLDKKIYPGLNRFDVSALTSGQYVLLFFQQGALMDTALVQVVQD